MANQASGRSDWFRPSKKLGKEKVSRESPKVGFPHSGVMGLKGCSSLVSTSFSKICIPTGWAMTEHRYWNLRPLFDWVSGQPLRDLRKYLPISHCVHLKWSRLKCRRLFPVRRMECLQRCCPPCEKCERTLRKLNSHSVPCIHYGVVRFHIR